MRSKKLLFYTRCRDCRIIMHVMYIYAVVHVCHVCHNVCQCACLILIQQFTEFLHQAKQLSVVITILSGFITK